MTTHRERVLTAVATLLADIPGAVVARNSTDLLRPQPGGLINLVDGTAEVVDVSLSPRRHTVVRTAEIDAVVPRDVPAGGRTLDQLTEAIGTALAGPYTHPDPTLGGHVEWMEALAPIREAERPEGSDAIDAHTIPLELHYTIDNPLEA